MSIIVLNLSQDVFSIGSFGLKWYSIAYFVGIYYSWFFIRKNLGLSVRQSDSLLLFSVLAIVVGARIGYVVFYDAQAYIKSPLEIIKIWKGGMSFHGGFIGVVIASFVFSKKNNISLLRFFDLVACSTTVGIFAGRLANFINQEILGIPTDGSWGIIFEAVDSIPRHPVQIYEAIGEGLIPFVILNILFFCTSIADRRGLLSGIFLLLYSSARIGIEPFREFDSVVFYFGDGISSGQILTAPIFVLGFFLIYNAMTAKMHD